MKDLNIVFLNYYMKDDILRAIDSVMKDISGSAFDIHITVVDNSNNQDSIGKDLYQKFPSVTYINLKENTGFGKGNAAGFKATPARYYFALNRDTIIPENIQNSFLVERPEKSK
jgi:GT2 family glycosyltransferase